MSARCVVALHRLRLAVLPKKKTTLTLALACSPFRPLAPGHRVRRHARERDRGQPRVVLCRQGRHGRQCVPAARTLFKRRLLTDALLPLPLFPRPVSDLQYHISKNTSWLLWLSKPFVSGLIKKALKESLEHAIVDYLRQADLQLFALQNRAIAATNAKPSPKDFLTAVFSSSVFGASSTTKLTQKGIVKYGRRGDYLLAIGADEQIFPGKAVSPAGERRKTALDTAASVAGSAGEALERGKIGADQLAVDADREAGKLGLKVNQLKRGEEQADGWRSDAFDL